nr:immunoglobulin light chain junction region [Macaca mulatta]MOV34063.1 immunoglobulin light chain junction region [Macaca mulatta]MOV34089.1 immunoglobulin light chain junction region [Macaca mulatta]MOV34136.1 immunoglobulin light chain junction region [Macaca mulatta]MOV34334.1 immunoglobulin light chain junction region [Macaca mulatta]
CIQGLEFPYSF